MGADDDQLTAVKCADLERQLADKDDQIAALTAQLSAKDDELETLRERLTTAENEVARLQSVEQQQQALDEVTSKKKTLTSLSRGRPSRRISARLSEPPPLPDDEVALAADEAETEAAPTPEKTLKKVNSFGAVNVLAGFNPGAVKLRSTAAATNDASAENSAAEAVKEDETKLPTKFTLTKSKDNLAAASANDSAQAVATPPATTAPKWGVGRAATSSSTSATGAKENSSTSSPAAGPKWKVGGDKSTTTAMEPPTVSKFGGKQNSSDAPEPAEAEPVKPSPFGSRVGKLPTAAAPAADPAPSQPAPKATFAGTKFGTAAKSTASEPAKPTQPATAETAKPTPSKFGSTTTTTPKPTPQSTPSASSTSAKTAPAGAANTSASSSSTMSTPELEILQWLAKVASESAITSSPDFKMALRDGQALCKMANKLRKDGAVIKINAGKFAVSHMENINAYLKVSSTYFKISPNDAFTSADLYDGTGLDKVLKHLQLVKKQFG